MSSIPLGPFDLVATIGRGGMGEVWRGVHRDQQLPVAVKVLSGDAALDPRFVAAFKNEVRAIAGLDHPHVILVLDYGTVPLDAARASDGRLVAGSPYLVMELLSGGSLRQEMARAPTWRHGRDILLCLMDALAHAHARGVVHLDLKPDNVLFGHPADQRPGLKLTDFGLARAVLRQEWENSELIAGTPLYMAPEQFTDRWRDYGPWTDLYALGVLAYTMLHGAPPWAEREYGALMQAHLWREVPPLKLRMAAPIGIESWVMRLLEKDPRRRYERVADAAWALLSLGEAPELLVDADGDELGPDEPAPSRTAVHQLYTVSTGLVSNRLIFEVMAEMPTERELLVPPEVAATQPLPLEPPTPPPEPDIDDRIVGRRYAVAVPPMPADWESPVPPSPSPRLVSAGLNLFWLRPVPLVDRQHERDVLWRALGEVREQGAARAVILQGAHGAGKSRLAEWLCERAHEVGAATWLRASHSADATPADGIGPMMSRYLRCTGLPRTQVELRLEGLLRRQGVAEAEEWCALTELVSPATEADWTRGARIISFSQPSERYALIRRHLIRACAERPVILCLDDVQWGEDALQFALYLIDARRRASLPVLLVLTLREESLNARGRELALLQRLSEQPGVRTLALRPLESDEHEALVRQMLNLEPALAAEVAARTQGNPLFAVQLLGDWVQRGLLELRGDSFGLRPGISPELPDDMHEVWNSRIDRVLEGHTGEDGVALELAAVLGNDVDGGEWEALCRAVGITPPWALAEAMLADRLILCAEGVLEIGWSFVHALLRESLERRAREGGRLTRHHLSAVSVLRERAGPWSLERVGRHLIAAGRLEEAIEPLLQGAHERREVGDLVVAEALLVERERVMEQLHLPVDDVRWGLGHVLHARVAIQRGRVEEADARAARAESDARRYGWRLVLPLALRERARARAAAGDYAHALRWVRESARLADELGDPSLSARVRLDQGTILLRRGAIGDAREAFQSAAATFEAVGDEGSLAESWRWLGNVEWQAGHLDEARAYILAALPWYERVGRSWSIGVCQNLLGDIVRLTGDFETAEAHYQEAVNQLQNSESPEALLPMLNLGLCLSEQGRHAEAREMLESGLAAVRRHHRRGLEGCVHICLLPSLADLGDWDAWDRHFSEGERLLEETGFIETDVARVAEQAGGRALLAGYVERARRVFGLALVQWSALGRSELGAPIEEALSLLPRDEAAPPPG